MNKTFYLTTPIYYVNARPHIGHAYTTLAADIIARYHKQKLGKESVFFLTGTDEHGAKVAEAASLANKDPQSFCDEVVQEFKEAWKALNINYNHFIRTTDALHEKKAAEFLTALKEKGALYEGDYVGLYCTGCESFITPSQLDENGNCPDHQKRPEMITEKNWFFALRNYLPRVEELVRNDTLRIEPALRKLEVLGLFKQGLEDFSVSRPSVKWGIPLPWDSTQTIYVWVEALLNYWTALHDTKDAAFWPPQLQLMAKDIIKFHCIFWPAMLLAYYDNDVSQLPNTIFAHGFFTVNGKKMSKTLGNVIDPVALVKEYGTDAARYLILSQFPFGADGDIDADRFTEKYNADLANGIGNLVSRVTTLCNKKIIDWTKFWQKTNQELTRLDKKESIAVFGTQMEQLRLYEAVELLIKIVKDSDTFLSVKEPWKLEAKKNQEELLNILSQSTADLIILGNKIRPFLPETAQKITERINAETKKIEIKEPLFPRK